MAMSNWDHEEIFMDLYNQLERTLFDIFSPQQVKALIDSENDFDDMREAFIVEVHPDYAWVWQ